MLLDAADTFSAAAHFHTKPYNCVMRPEDNIAYAVYWYTVLLHFTFYIPEHRDTSVILLAKCLQCSFYV